MTTAPSFKLLSRAGDTNSRQSGLAKEILAQPEGIRRTLGQQNPHAAKFAGRLLVTGAAGIDVVAVGSSKNAATIGAFLLRERLFLNVQEPSDYTPRFPDALLVSQSGESADLLPVLEMMKSKNVAVAVITNSPESTLAREAAYPIFTYAEKEEAIAATGSMTSAIAAFFNLGISLGIRGGEALAALPEKLGDFLQNIPAALAEMAESLLDVGLLASLGKGVFKGVAEEAALKISETAEIIALSHDPLTFRHGYIAPFGADSEPLASLKKAILLFAPEEDSAIAAKYQENGHPLYSFRYGAGEIGANSVLIPGDDALTRSVLSIVASQVLAHDIAALKGIEPGTSKLLVKVVAD